MGILTLLRNAFGRSRKPRATEPEGAPETPEQPPVPEPRQSRTEEHDLVAAAFDNVKVPHQVPPADQPETAEPESTAEPEPAEPKPAADPVLKAEAEPAPEPHEPHEPHEPQPNEPTATAEPEPAEPKAEADNVLKAEAEAEPAPKPEAAPEETAPPEPAPESVPETGREPEAATAPEPEAAAEVEPVTETAAEPEPAAEGAAPEPQPEAEAAPEPEPETEPAPEPEATAPADPKPEPPTVTHPQAADGEDAPLGSPAPDDETRTGDAGANTDAEGEAEATTHTTRNTDTGTDTDAEGGGEPHPAPKPKPATPLAKVKSRTPALTAAYKAATTTLRKKNLTGTRAKLYLVLDRSASMRPYYKDGSAQSLADQTLALAAHLDPGPDPTVHVVFFSTEVDGTTDLTLAPGHDTRIDDVHAGLGRMGRTSYHAAVAAVLDHYDTHAGSDTVPALVIFQTDGAPDAKTPATQALTEAAETHPGVFFSFVAFGDHDNKAFDYLRRLKTPNASFFHAGPTPRELTDTELYEGVLADWRP
ncbi:VWA domain-containing protein [Streptomyces sp. WELS2]|uniref:VWA domain-containing protein n=1 Tax=Streptomyces sp. WELS2 TaxID=2749435 RepID=UPI0015F11F97|nr:VWA domain-containing protein [Streptomyces sp. WELS2]